jgi:hypothetical protein
MNRISSIKNAIIKYTYIETPKTLGRWSIDYCNDTLNKKIDLSNEDHCGPCGQYALSKYMSNKKYIQSNIIYDIE